MLPAQRELQIINLIDQQGSVTVRELAERFEVTEVTIRRDLQRMEERDLLRRTHGGAVGHDYPADTPPHAATESPDVDALIIAPVDNRAVHTLREKAIRDQIPFFAESSPQEGAIYLGCRNHDAGCDLGIWTGHYVQSAFEGDPVVLDITQRDLSNTRERSQGFFAGLRRVLGDEVERLSVDGRGTYNQAYQVAYDALRSEPRINIIFGINDDALLAGLQAYADLGYDLEHLVAVNIGGEGTTIFNALLNQPAFKACVALFPEVVGRLGVDAACRLWNGYVPDGAIYTPHRLLTHQTLPDFYERTTSGWQLKPGVIDALLDAPWHEDPPPAVDKRIAFVIHYRTHEWYQNIARAMELRAQALGIKFASHDMEDNLAAEIRDLRRLIGKHAAAYVNDGETILLDNGSTTRYMAHFLAHHNDLTIITNSLAVFNQLHKRPNLKLILTGGLYDPASDAFTGRGAHLLLQELRADKVFLVAGGLSDSFGISSVTMPEAEVRRTMIHSSREVVALADHTILDTDSNVSVASLDVIDTLITDAGIAAAQKLQLAQRGIRVIIAGGV